MTTTADHDPERQVTQAPPQAPTPARILTLDAERFRVAWQQLNGGTARPVRPYRGSPDQSAWSAFHQTMTDRCDARWQPRTSGLERDASRVQVASYTLIRRGGKVLAYTRTRGGDARLSLRRSIGVGGHVESRDDAFARDFAFMFGGRPIQDVVAACAWRELCEEVGGCGRILPTVPRVRAYLYDPSDEVGRVHLGAVCTSDAPDDWEPSPNGEVRETGWIAPAPILAAPPGEWEGWSVRLAEALASDDGQTWRALS